MYLVARTVQDRSRPPPAAPQGQDGVPLRWGRWDGSRLTVTRIGDDDRFLMDVSPDGTQFLTIAPWQAALALHHLPDGAEPWMQFRAKLLRLPGRSGRPWPPAENL
ncbi:hypothetical protein Asi03nite_65230 [Actinoplanes siamensis]|uniref:Uncharacterized protein n=1 Tax=Actinoplanes siamensis TaxID=1223317 RepID=A0A919NE88_9ACTN|nr:hypothetical protein Asi03nite_65230 [Actinoplanes siamensis]